MKDWNDREISVGYSDGGVVAVEDFSDQSYQNKHLALATVGHCPKVIQEQSAKSIQR